MVRSFRSPLAAELWCSEMVWTILYANAQRYPEVTSWLQGYQQPWYVWWIDSSLTSHEVHPNTCDRSVDVFINRLSQLTKQDIRGLQFAANAVVHHATLQQRHPSVQMAS
jgi:hypothetical protein